MKLYSMIQLMEIAHIFRRQFGEQIMREAIEKLTDREFVEFQMRFHAMLRLLEQMQHDFEISLKHVEGGKA